MAFDFKQAFALTDNPFSPIRPLPGLNRITLQNQLDSNPLLLESEPALQMLFNPDAGPFSTYMKNFKNFARRQGYYDVPPPPSAGVSSHIISIWGYEGTGKSTLAQVFISWLKTCTPRIGNWYIREDWSRLKVKEVQKQLDRIEEAQNEIIAATGPDSYCCIVADNLIAGVLDRVLEMYDELTRDRIVFLILISSDTQLYPHLSGETKRQINSFRMRALSENDAVAFIKHRINAFRVPKEEQPPWLEAYSLFPFDEEDVRAAFARGILWDNRDTVALRDFGKMVNVMLLEKLDTLADEFDIMQLSEAEARQHAICLAVEYDKLVAA